MIVAFDVDGTLINFDNTPNHDVLDICRWFIRHRHHVVVWSGGGKDYAMHWCRKLGLTNYHEGAVGFDMPEVVGKDEAKRINADLCFDDEFVQLATVNIKVNPRLSEIS